MPRILYLVSDPGPSGPSKSVALLAGHLTKETFDTQVRFLGDVVRHPFDALGAWRLRQEIARSKADVLHTVGAVAAQFAGLLSLPRVGPRPCPPVVVSAADRAAPGASRWLLRRSLRRARRVIATDSFEADRYAELGAPRERIVVVPTGVPPAPPTPDGVAFRRSLGIPDQSRLVFAAGRFDRVAELKSAVWAFDVLRHVAPDLHLVLVGDGPERPRIERFAKALEFDDYRVRFAGVRPDLPGLLALAEVVWVTHERGGTNTAREAMAAGRPVVAFRTPEMAEVVADGGNGVLIPQLDRVRLAAATNELLENPARASGFGTAGQAMVRERFPLSAMVACHAAVYDDVAKG